MRGPLVIWRTGDNGLDSGGVVSSGGIQNLC